MSTRRPMMPARNHTPVQHSTSPSEIQRTVDTPVNTGENIISTTSQPSQNVTVLNKPVWSVDSLSPVTQNNPSTNTEEQIEQKPANFRQSPAEPIGVSSVQPPQSPEPQTLSFEAPPKPKKSLPKLKIPRIRLRDLSKTTLVVVGAVMGLAVFSGATYGLIAWQSNRTDPSTILKNGLSNHLSLRQVEVNSASGQNARVTAYDFAEPKNPVVTSRFVLQQYGASFDMSTYGDNQNTFLRYNKLPDVISANIKSDAETKWIKLRDQDKTPKDVSRFLASLADPRTQIFGPLIFGNFDEKTKTELTNFLIKSNTYKIELGSKSPAKTKIDGKKVVILPVAVDVGQLKVGIQSAALSLGYEPDDIAEAVRALDFYKGAKADIYVTSRGNTIIKMVITAQNGSQTEIAYKNFDKATTEAQPTTYSAWKDMAQIIWQIEAQAAAKQQPQVIDANRKSSLDSLASNLASYHAQKGYYPTLASMNDLSWLSSLTLGAPEMQRDPLGTNLVLSVAPKPGSYAYIPAPAGGSGACDNLRVPCATFKLVAVLSDGRQYLAHSP